MKTQFTSRLALVLVVALTAAFAAPVVATAQTLEPTQSQYDDTLTQISQGTNPGNPGDPDEPTGTLDENVGPLPFTGFDVIAMAAVALGVAGLGLALQRAVTRSPQQ